MFFVNYFVMCNSASCSCDVLMQVDIAQEMRGILVRIGRFRSLEVHYTKVHLKPMKQLWDEFESRQQGNKLAAERSDRERPASAFEFQSSSSAISFSSWLPSFYDELLLYLEQEWKWLVHSTHC